MDLSFFVSLFVAIGLFGLIGWLIVWAPLVMLRKAGFPGLFGFLTVILFPISLFVFAFADWPVLRELAWLRMKTGESTGYSIAQVEGHAVTLEKRGEWNRAIEVYEDLARRTSDEPTVRFYRTCIERLHQRVQENGVG